MEYMLSVISILPWTMGKPVEGSLGDENRFHLILDPEVCIQL